MEEMEILTLKEIINNHKDKIKSLKINFKNFHFSSDDVKLITLDYLNSNIYNLSIKELNVQLSTEQVNIPAKIKENLLFFDLGDINILIEYHLLNHIIKKRNLNVSFYRAGSGSPSTKINLPLSFLKSIGVTMEDRSIEVTLIEDEKTIIIKKGKSTSL